MLDIKEEAIHFDQDLLGLLEESRYLNLVFHQLVRHLVIDFASFDTIRREKVKSNITLKRRGKLL